MSQKLIDELNPEESIKQLIKNQVEESISLEFKASGSLSSKDSVKTEISKDITAFANSAGGIIIYGIDEADHKASGFSYIDGNMYTKEWLEQIIQSRIHRKIEGLTIVPVRVDNELAKSIYVVNIPQSSNAPHMAHDNRFYKRFNFESVRMEEYEVRQLYERQVRTELSIEEIVVESQGAMTSRGGIQHQRFELTFMIKNIGKTIENQYKLELAIPMKSYARVNSQNSEIEPFFVREENPHVIFAVPNNSPIFQGELSKIITARIHVDKQTIQELMEVPLIIKLHYSGGVKSKKINLSKKLYVNPHSIPFDDIRF